ncbi:MAG: hypothetical protein ACTH6N_03195 [Brachybacterium tyrofermentans]|uniref:hypothetical protein n=1 Tax=Brachybacterium tyrofermentans TaxID=47848 RepID=UPI001868F34B|nr:hypothetical protein [Brachybacterium tyrofermentans]
MHITTSPSSSLAERGLSRSRLLLLLFAGIAAVFLLAACGEVDDSTEIEADGSGVQTLAVVIGETDMEDVEGGAATIESVIEANNPGLEYQGMTKNGTDTVFTLTLSFKDAKDYAAKAQPVLAAGELTKTAEVTFTPPSPPFNSGYTLTRNFTANDLTRWAVKALVDDGKVANATDSDIDSALEQGDVTVSVDGSELERDSYAGDGSATVWTNAAAVGFDSVKVVTAGAEDPAADAYTRTLTYELTRATYLDAKDQFDAFFAAATPEGGELTPAGETGTTWVIAFPQGTAEQVGTWTDTALATTGSVLSVETAPSSDDPFAIETRVVDTIECTVACGEMGTLEQALLVPAGFSGGDVENPDATEEIPLEGGTEAQVITKNITFSKAAYDVTINRDGGGTVTMDLSLPAADDAVVTEKNVVAFLGEGTERSESEGIVTYTRTAEAETSAEFSGALQKLGFDGVDGAPEVSVVERDGGTYSVSLAMGLNEKLWDKAGSEATWTIRGDGLRPTSLTQDEQGTAVLGEETITVEDSHGVILTFAAERTGLGIGAIVGILAVLAVLGLLLAAGIVAFLNRAKLKALFGGSTTEAAAGSGAAGPGVQAGSGAPQHGGVSDDGGAGFGGATPQQGDGVQPDAAPQPGGGVQPGGAAPEVGGSTGDAGTGPMQGPHGG